MVVHWPVGGFFTARRLAPRRVGAIRRAGRAIFFPTRRASAPDRPVVLFVFVPRAAAWWSILVTLAVAPRRRRIGIAISLAPAGRRLAVAVRFAPGRRRLAVALAYLIAGA
jgi:hypothetical protein